MKISAEEYDRMVEELDELANEIRGEPIQPGDKTATWFRDRYGYADTKGGNRLMKRIAQKDNRYKLVEVFDGERTMWALRKVG